MTDAEILQRLTGIFREVFDDDTLVLTEATTAEDVEEWDSFNHINIIVATEASFRVKFQTAEIEGLKNVGHLVALIQRKLPPAGR